MTLARLLILAEWRDLEFHQRVFQVPGMCIFAHVRTRVRLTTQPKNLVRAETAISAGSSRRMPGNWIAAATPMHTREANKVDTMCARQRVMHIVAHIADEAGGGLRSLARRLGLERACAEPYPVRDAE